MEKILDRGFSSDWGGYIHSKSEILWSEKPKNEISIRVLENNTTESGAIHSVIGLTMTWIMLSYYAKSLVESGSIALGIMLFIIGLITPFIGDVLFYYKNSKLEYAITKDYVLFKMFSGIHYKVHAIPMDTIISVTSTNVENNRAVLHIVTSAEIDFKTFSIKDQSRRNHPTFEQITHYELVLAIIKDRIKNNEPQKLIYKQPVLSKTGKVLFQFVLGLLILTFFFVGYELYFLPMLKTGFHKLLSEIPMYFYLLVQVGLFLSLHYIQKEDKILDDNVFQTIGLNVLLILTYLLTLGLY